MQHEFIKKSGTNSLVILFAGWGMSPKPFYNIICNHDLLVVYDYNDFYFDLNIIEGYSNYYVFAWSFGVYAASEFISLHPNLPIGLKMAVNGTPFPIDDEKGIPENIFHGTLNNLSERSLLKFYRRMCRDNVQYKDFLDNIPDREISSLHSELENMFNHSKSYSYPDVIWDKVIIGANDLIFPPANQRRAWAASGKSRIIETGESHLPDNIGAIINDNTINKRLLKRRFSRQMPEYDRKAVFQQHISKILHEIWMQTDYRKNSSVLEIGCGTGFLTKLYVTGLAPKQLILNDLCSLPDDLPGNLPATCRFIQGDAEELDVSGEKFDYIVSSSVVQWFENIREFFRKAYNMLNDGGVLVISSFGRDNMNEVSNITGVTLTYHSADMYRLMLENDFEILHISEGYEYAYFDTPLDVLKHLKSTGVNSITANGRWTKTRMNEFTEKYPSTDKGYRLTYNPVYIIARKK